MPVLQVDYPASALDATNKAALGTQLTELLLEMEGGARTPGGLTFATVLFREAAPGDWYVGGRTDATHVHPPGKFLVRLSIPEGYMNQAQKSLVHQQINGAFLQSLSCAPGPQAGASILVTIEEVTEGNWGCAGRTINMSSIAESVGLSRAGPRFRWVLDYFAAKARQFAAAGYPADTGGLLVTDTSRPTGSE